MARRIDSSFLICSLWAHEAAMEVLSWLEDSAFEWDMFVDLPENTIRYCFRTLDDATAFKRRFGEEKRAMLA
jgi:hypothetical protein